MTDPFGTAVEIEFERGLKLRRFYVGHPNPRPVWRFQFPNLVKSGHWLDSKFWDSGVADFDTIDDALTEVPRLHEALTAYWQAHYELTSKQQQFFSVAMAVSSAGRRKAADRVA